MIKLGSLTLSPAGLGRALAALRHARGAAGHGRKAPPVSASWVQPGGSRPF
jgi:hypothetical protein